MARLLLAGGIVRLAAVRLGCTQQPEAEWIEAARGYAKALEVTLNALNHSVEILKFCRAFNLSPDRHMIASINREGSFDELFGAKTDSSFAAWIEGTPDQHLLEMSALSILVAPSQEAPVPVEGVPLKVFFGVDYGSQPPGKDLIKHRPERWQSVRASPHRSSHSCIARQP